ncbi:MAG: DNA polymerase III subunit epsilon [Sulfuricella sp.]|nr:DNA polymerase III subunit epsilon [Sulfuricella sp.]
MRQIFLDTETTGLDPKQGHRIIEVAGVEMVNRRLTGKHFHRYLNPQREIDAGAQQVHGISLEFLQDKPLFRDIAEEFLTYVGDAELIIHNAPFDVGFLNSELGKLGLDKIDGRCAITDTLKMAKTMRPGQKNNLDALCRFYQIDNSGRTLHGALLDAELLAEVYLAMTRGQESLMIDLEEAPPSRTDTVVTGNVPRRLVIRAATPEELIAHQQQIEDIDKASKGKCLWKAIALPQEAA